MYHIWRPKTLHRREQYLAINNADLDSGASPLSADEVQTLQHLLQRFQSSGSDQNLGNNTQFSSAITVSMEAGILFCPVSHSVILSETLTLLITFEK